MPPIGTYDSHRYLTLYYHRHNLRRTFTSAHLYTEGASPCTELTRTVLPGHALRAIFTSNVVAFVKVTFLGGTIEKRYVLVSAILLDNKSFTPSHDDSVLSAKGYGYCNCRLRVTFFQVLSSNILPHSPYPYPSLLHWADSCRALTFEADGQHPTYFSSWFGLCSRTELRNSCTVLWVAVWCYFTNLAGRSYCQDSFTLYFRTVSLLTSL